MRPNELKQGQVLEVEVKEQHIKQARPGGFTCPIAMALKELFPGHNPLVGKSYSSLANEITGCPAADFKLHEDAVYFVEEYDALQKVQPATVHLEVL